MKVSQLRNRRQSGVTLAVALAVTTSLGLPQFVTSAHESAPRVLDRVAGGRTETISNYHARFDEAYQGALAKAGRAGRRSAVSAKESAAEARLAARVPALHVERDQISLLPVMVLSYESGRRLTGAAKAGTSPEDAARGFLRANKDLYGLTDADLATVKVRYVTSPEGGATVVKLDQYVNGVQLFDTEMAVTMSKQNEIVATGGRIYPGVSAAAKAAGEYALAAPDAIVKGLADLTGRQTAASDFAFVKKDDASYDVFEFTLDRGAEHKFLSELVRARRVLFPTGAGQFEPGYYLELWVSGEPAGSGPVFSYVISGRDGSVLFRNNLSSNAAHTYRVYADTVTPFRPWDGPTGTVGTPHPTGVPDGYQAPFVSPNDVTLDSLLGASDPWLPSGATATMGNNTDAYLDLGGGDGYQAANDVRAATSAPGQFLYTYNTSLNVSDATNRQASCVGMFFQVNWLHDIWYQHGVTETAGNAQTDNYGRGGAANDSLKAEGQDSSGTDNANMSTPADGGRPRMQMYRFRAGGRLVPDRDGTFDMLIVGHEMGHYISNRLIGNSSGLSNNQGRSMGEGWGDFNCVLTTAQPTDNLDGTYAVGGYTDLMWCSSTFVDNYYYSIRRYPYSANKLKNPFTFKDIGPGITTYPGVPGDPCTSLTASPAEVHNAGEVWAQMLWEGYVGLAKAYGQQAGHDKMMQYVIDGMKGTPSAPTFVQARDAVVAAAAAANSFSNPRDAQILWKAFSKRGIGEGAVAPPSNSTNHSGITESFVAPAGLPDDTFGVVQSGTFFLQNVAFGGFAELAYGYGTASMTPLFGNWDGGSAAGAAAADNPGVYDPASGSFFLKNSQGGGVGDVSVQFGPANAGWLPIVGDWNGDGATTIGLYEPTTGTFFLRNANAPGAADVVFGYGPGGAGWLPIIGDWNNDGVDTVGLYDPSTGTFFLKNSNTAGPADIVFSFGPGGQGWKAIAGDWNSDGIDTVAVYSPSNGVFFFRNTNAAGAGDDIIGFGPANAIPVAGNFDGQ